MANKQDKRIDLNRTNVFTLTAMDNDGAVIDLTGAVVQWGFAANAGDDDPLFVDGSEGGHATDIAADPTTGVVTISLDPADTATVEAGTFYHELTVTKDGNTVQGVYGVLEVGATLLDPPA